MTGRPRLTCVRRFGVVVCSVSVLALVFQVPAAAQKVADRVDSGSARTKTRLERKPSSSVRPPRRHGSPVADVEALQKRYPDGSIAGTPVVGELGVTETVAEIMERERLAPKRGREIEGEDENELRINPNRRFNPQNALSPTTDRFPEANGAEKAAATLNPQTLSTSFTGATVLGTNPTNATPPDSMGAVGPTQYVVGVNGRLVTFNKTTGLADGILNVSMDTFFNSVRNLSGTSDPRVRYDRLSGRWFVIIINTSFPNRILVAVSSGANITGAGSFTFFFFAGTNNSGQLLDYPTLGIDQNALYIGGNRFTTTAFLGTDAFVVRKSSVTSGGPIVVTTFTDLTGTATGPGPYTPQGVDNYDPSATEGYFIGVDNATFGTLMLKEGQQSRGSAQPFGQHRDSGVDDPIPDLGESSWKHRRHGRAPRRTRRPPLCGSPSQWAPLDGT